MRASSEFDSHHSYCSSINQEDIMRYGIVFVALVLSACSKRQRIIADRFSDPADVTCYSAGQIIFKGRSTSWVSSTQQSDGWEFIDSTSGNFIRVSGDCVIRNWYNNALVAQLAGGNRLRICTVWVRLPPSAYGWLAERFIALVLKTSIPKGNGGSNPSPSSKDIVWLMGTTSTIRVSNDYSIL